MTERASKRRAAARTAAPGASTAAGAKPSGAKPAEPPSGGLIDLRRRAEEQAGALEPQDLQSLSPEETRQMFHELSVRQIELEMQNEELRRAQLELEESRRRYFDLYDLAPVGYCTIAENGSIMEANFTAAALLGVARDALARQPLTRFIVPADQDTYYHHRKALFATGAPQTCELRLRRSDGPPLWALLTATAARGAEGASVCRVALSDISQRKQAEEALLESEELYRLATENVSDVIWIIDVDALRFTYVSLSVKALCGLTPDEAIHQDVAATFTAASWALIEHAIPQRLDESRRGIGKTHVDQIEWMRRDGGTVWTETTTRYAVDDRTGNLVIYGVSRDISERRRAEAELSARSEALTRSNALLDAVLDSPTGILIFALDTMHCYTAFNEPHRREMLRAWSTEIDVGVNMLDLLTVPEVRQIARRSMDRALGGETFTETQTQPDTGIVYEFSWNPIRAADGSVVGLTCFAQDVTLMRQAADAVRESREDLNRAQAVAHTGSWRLDVRRNVLLWSDENHRIFGLPPGTPMSYETFLGCVHPDDRGFVDGAWTAALDGAPYDIEHRIVAGDTVKWVRERVELEFDQDGLLRGGFGTTEDVTERRQAEEERRGALEWLSATQRAARAGFWDWDLLSGELTWSQEFYELFGLPVTSEASFETWRAVLHPDDLAAAEAGITDAIEARVALENEYRIVHPDGTVIWIRAVGTTTYDDEGQPLRMSGICIDITTRRAAESALRESEAKYRHLFEAFHETVAVYEVVRDEQDIIVDRVLRDGNQALVETVGASSIHGLIGKTAGQIFGREYADAELPHVREAMESGTIHVFESQRLTHGEERHYITSVVPLDDDHYLSASRDITSIKETEEALRDSEQRYRELAKELEVERGKLAAAIDSVDVGLVFTEGDGSFLSMNAKALALHGFDSAESMFVQFERYAQEFELLCPDGSLMPLEDWPMSRALRGEFVRDYEARVHRRSCGEEWIGSFSAAPVYGADGEIVFFVFSIFDLTVRRRLQEELRRELETSNVLLEAASTLAEWTDSLETLNGVVRLVAAVSSHSRVGLHVWHAEDQELELVAATGAYMPPVGTRTSPDRLSVKNREALLTKRTTVTDFDELAPGGRGLADALGARLSLSVPILHRGGLVGLLAIDEPGERRPFTERQIELVAGIAAQTAVAMENAGLYDAQRRIATVLQEQFIHPLPRIDGLELAVVSEAAHQPELIGGDFHDVFELPHGLVAVLLGDVEGKGVSAAALSETVRSAVRALAIVSPSPRYILNNVNRMLLQQRSTQFVTALLTIVDPVEGLGLSASAGHPAGILVHDGTVSTVTMRFGVPLGALPWDHEQSSFRLEPGDSLVVYTDGVSEARQDGHIFGEEGVVEAVRAVAHEAPDRMAAAVRDAAAGFAGRLQDDMQLVVMRFTGRHPALQAQRRPSRLSLVVPDAPWHLIDIRGAARDFLTAHTIDAGVVDDLVMCVEEACTNALRHSGSTEPTEVRLTIDQSVVDISVRDHGCGFDAAGLDLTQLPDPLALGGRGLYLIRSVVDELELVKREGTTVHLRKYRNWGDVT